MGLFDVDGFGDDSGVSSVVSGSVSEKSKFSENAFDKSIVDNLSPLLKMEVINKNYNLGELLKNLGVDLSGSNIYCPFHADELTGKPSARYHPDTDLLFCFSESKMYSAYHAIKILYGVNTDKVFYDLWYKMPLDQRHSLMDKYDKNGGTFSSSETDKKKSEWSKYNDSVLVHFRNRKVNFRQYKNALYKVLKLIQEKE